MKKIMVIAAHPDDEIIGCGGTMKRLVNEGNEVYSLILSDGVTSRYEECTRQMSQDLDNRIQENIGAGKIIGYKETLFYHFTDNCFDKESLLNIVKSVEKSIAIIKPTAIFTHHYGDLNIDHKKTFEAVQTATRPMKGYSVKELYCFETLSSTEWNFISDSRFAPNYFVNIESTLLDKLEAMKCYASELRELPHPRSIEGLELKAKIWGTVIGCKYAEAFEIIRKID